MIQKFKLATDQRLYYGDFRNYKFYTTIYDYVTNKFWDKTPSKLNFQESSLKYSEGVPQVC